jgi:hypothetical protein
MANGSNSSVPQPTHTLFASAVEPEIAKVFEEMNHYRMINMQTYAKWIAARGPLRVSTRRAGAIIWALASPDVARMLCEEISWTESPTPVGWPTPSSGHCSPTASAVGMSSCRSRS